MSFKSTLDVIDMMGPDATREDYESLAEMVQELLADPEMWSQNNVSEF